MTSRAAELVSKALKDRARGEVHSNYGLNTHQSASPALADKDKGRASGQVRLGSTIVSSIPQSSPCVCFKTILLGNRNSGDRNDNGDGKYSKYSTILSPLEGMLTISLRP